MPNRIAVSNLNARTVDILNTIRANASYEYQTLVPEVTSETDIPKVGEILYGYPALANQFINALVTRIASVRMKSALFNNAYAELKKGYLEFGEVVEEVFVNICKAREFSAEKAHAREFKRSIPDVRTAFHAMNWRVQYPITIQDEDLRTAFLSVNGVQDLIAKIVSAVYVSAEYDEYLLFKYLMIKAIAHGKMFPVAFDASNMSNAAKAFRGISNQITFMSKKYNSAGVTTSTSKDEQYIFMDSTFNAGFDVDVLASAFNMDKANFIGKLKLIDDWTTFDNDRFSEIQNATDMLPVVTDDELALMSDVKAVIIDKEWFQIYDNLSKMTEQYSASGMYWNYFYNVWKTVSSSPFSNAIVFVDDAAEIDLPDTITVEITSKNVSEGGTIMALNVDEDNPSIAYNGFNFVQTEDATEKGVAVQKYGAVIFPPLVQSIDLELEINGIRFVGTLNESSATGATITLTNENEISLNATAFAIAGVTLTPTFASTTYAYTGVATADDDPAALTLTFASGVEAHVRVDGEEVEISDGVDITEGVHRLEAWGEYNSLEGEHYVVVITAS